MVNLLRILVTALCAAAFFCIPWVTEDTGKRAVLWVIGFMVLFACGRWLVGRIPVVRWWIGATDEKYDDSGWMRRRS